MGSRLERRKRIRTVLLVTILLSLVCYCLGVVVLQLVTSRRVSSTATPTLTVRASVTPQPSPILVATATLLAVATACLYNQIAGLFGGVVVTFGLRKRRTR